MKPNSFGDQEKPMIMSQRCNTFKDVTSNIVGYFKVTMETRLMGLPSHKEKGSGMETKKKLN